MNEHVRTVHMERKRKRDEAGGYVDFDVVELEDEEKGEDKEFSDEADDLTERLVKKRKGYVKYELEER